MSSSLKKASALGAIILASVLLTVSVSAQTPAPVNDLMAKPNLESGLEKKSVSGEGTVLASGREEISEPKPEAGAASPSSAHSAINTAGGAAVERRNATGTTAARPQAVDDDEWHFQVSPYAWLMSIHGNAGVGNRTIGENMSFGDVFDALNFFAMGTFEARKGRFFSLTDVEYASISDEKATPGPFFSSVDAGFKMFIFDQEVGYRLYRADNGGSVDVLGGIRLWHLSTDFEFGAGILPATRIVGNRTWVDGVAGLRGKAPLSEKVFVTGKFDLGAGGSEFTWQVFGGLGYNIRPNVSLIGGYRALDVNYDNNNFLYDMNHRGPILGAAFRF